MTLGTMQPLFSYLGSFSLIRTSDQWILLDSVQNKKRDWVIKVRIVHITRIIGRLNNEKADLLKAI